MSDRNEEFEKILDIATVGLKNDSELCLDVRRELKSHLLFAFDAARKDGKSETESIATAIEQFGKPAELADSLIAANTRRMKLRARFRLVIYLFLIPLALLVLISTYGPLWNVVFYPVVTPSTVFGHRYSEPYEYLTSKFKADWKKLPEEQRLIMQSSRKPELFKELHAKYPENRVYMANYISSLMFRGKWYDNTRKPSHAKILEELDKAIKQEPENAYYNFLKSCIYISKSIKNTCEKPYYRITYRQAFNRAIAEYFMGIRKPYCRKYSMELWKLRLKMIGPLDNYFRQTLYPAIRPWNMSPVMELFRYAFNSWVEELISQGRIAEAEQLLDSWIPFIGKICSGNMNIDEIRMVAGSAYEFRKDVPRYYRMLGREKKAKEFERITEPLKQLYAEKNRLYERKLEFYKRKGINRLQNYFDEFEEYGNIPLDASVWCENRYLFPEELLKIARKQEYAIVDQFAIIVTIFFLTVMMIASLTGWIIMRIRLHKELAPALFIPDRKRLEYLLSSGIVLPLILWLLLTNMDILNGREFAFMVNFPRVFFQTLFLVVIVMTLPFSICTGFIRQRCRQLGIMTPKTNLPHQSRLYWIGIAVLLTASMISWQEFLSEWRWVMGAVILAAAILLVAVPTAVFIGRFVSSKYKFYRGAMFAALIPAGALMIITLGIIVLPYLHILENYYFENNFLMKFKSETILYEPEYRDLMKYKHCIEKVLKAAKKTQLKL